MKISGQFELGKRSKRGSLVSTFKHLKKNLIESCVDYDDVLFTEDVLTVKIESPLPEKKGISILDSFKILVCHQRSQSFSAFDGSLRYFDPVLQSRQTVGRLRNIFVNAASIAANRNAIDFEEAVGSFLSVESVFMGWNASYYLHRNPIAEMLTVEDVAFFDPSSDHFQLLFSLIQDFALAFKAGACRGDNGKFGGVEEGLFLCFWNHFPYLEHLETSMGPSAFPVFASDGKQKMVTLKTFLRTLLLDLIFGID